MVRPIMVRNGDPSPSAVRHARLKQLFFRAIDLAAEDRRVFLDQECGEDKELRADIDSLLRHHRRSDLPEDFELADSLSD